MRARECLYCHNKYEIVCKASNQKRKYCCMKCARHHIAQTMWSDKNFRLKRKKQLQDFKESPNYNVWVTKISENSKARWQDPEYKRRVVESLNKTYNDSNKSSELKKNASEKSKARWRDSDYRNMVCKSIRAYHKNNPDASERVSIRMKTKWSDNEWHRIQTQRIKDGCQDESRNKRISNSHKLRIKNDPVYRESFKVRYEANLRSDESKKKVRDATIARWNDPDFKKQMSIIHNSDTFKEKQRRASKPNELYFKQKNLLLENNIIGESLDKWASVSYYNNIHALARHHTEYAYIYIYGFENKDYIKVGFSTSQRQFQRYEQMGGILLFRFKLDADFACVLEPKIHNSFPRVYKSYFTQGITEYHKLDDLQKIVVFINNELHINNKKLLYFRNNIIA